MTQKVWQALEQTGWVWEDHDKFEEIIIPRYLNELTCSNWKPFKKRGEREGDLHEMIMYLIFWVDGEMTRANPRYNEIDVELKSVHWSWREIPWDGIMSLV